MRCFFKKCKYDTDGAFAQCLNCKEFVDGTLGEDMTSIYAFGTPMFVTHPKRFAKVREQMLEEGGFRTPYDYFVSRVKKYLHVVLILLPKPFFSLYRHLSFPASNNQEHIPQKINLV